MFITILCNYLYSSRFILCLETVYITLFTLISSDGTFINTNFRKTFVFHKAHYDKINEYFSNFKWQDIFHNRNANECWMKFLEIAKEAVELYVATRGQRKRKVRPWMTKKGIAN